VPVTLATYALTTVERVKEQGSGISSTDPSQDEAIRFLINDASTQMMNECEREFKSTLVGSQARTFQINYGCYGYGGGYIEFRPFDAQTVTAVVVETQPTGGNITLDATKLQYQALPVGQPDDVYTGVAIYSPGGSYGSAYAAGIQHTASVTGTWGWPSVPADVESMCVETVKEWLLTGYQLTSPLGIPGEQAQAVAGARHELPWSVKRGLARYSTVVVA
jgi:hypothetical protein